MKGGRKRERERRKKEKLNQRRRWKSKSSNCLFKSKGSEAVGDRRAPSSAAFLLLLWSYSSFCLSHSFRLQSLPSSHTPYLKPTPLGSLFAVLCVQKLTGLHLDLKVSRPRNQWWVLFILVSTYRMEEDAQVRHHTQVKKIKFFFKKAFIQHLSCKDQMIGC